MRKFLISFLFFLFHTMLFAQSFLTISPERPRVEINSERFTTLKSQLKDAAFTRIDSIYHALKEGSDKRNFWICGSASGINLCGNEASWKWDWDKIDTNEALIGLKLILLDYNITEGANKFLQEKRIQFIADEMIKRFVYWDDSIDYTRPLQGDLGSEKVNMRTVARLSSILFDWGYKALQYSNSETGQLTSEILANRIFDLNNHYMNHYIYDNYFGNGLKNNYYTGGHSLQDNVINLRVALALYGAIELTQTQRLEVESRIQFIYNNLESNFLPIHKFYAVNDPSSNFSDDIGGSHWSGVYSLSARQILTEYFYLITAATDTNLFQEHSWINNLAQQHYYLTTPNFYSLNFGDGLVNFWHAGNDWTIIHLFNNFNTNINDDLMNSFEQNNSYSARNLTEELLHRNFTKEVKLKERYLPNNTWFSERTGLFVYKSSFEKDATMIAFLNAPTNLNNNHQHRDNNSFQIYKNGPLFTDSGVYDYYPSPHHQNYYSRTIAHNTITVYDPEEDFGDFINDGGQILKESFYNFKQIDRSYDYDAWANYIDNDTFTYFVSDASDSYSRKKVRYYQRKFLNLKKEDKIIILDIVKQPKKRNPFQTNFNFHVQNKPVLYSNATNEDLLANKNDGVYIFNDINSYLIFNDTGGNAVLNTLFPSDNKTAVIGGPTYKYYVEDQKKGGTTNLVSEKYETANRTQFSDWRVEIRANVEPKKNKYVFLNSISLGTQENPAVNTSQFLSNIDTSISLVWDKDVFVFHNRSSNLRLKTHEIDISSLYSQYNVYAFDLLPQKRYSIYIDGTEQSVVYSDNKGAIKISDILLNGKTLEIRKK